MDGGAGGLERLSDPSFEESFCNLHGPFVHGSVGKTCSSQMQEGRAHIENLKTGRLLGLGAFLQEGYGRFFLHVLIVRLYNWEFVGIHSGGAGFLPRRERYMAHPCSV